MPDLKPLGPADSGVASFKCHSVRTHKQASRLAKPGALRLTFPSSDSTRWLARSALQQQASQASPASQSYSFLSRSMRVAISASEHRGTS